MGDDRLDYSIMVILCASRQSNTSNDDVLLGRGCCSRPATVRPRVSVGELEVTS